MHWSHWEIRRRHTHLLPILPEFHFDASQYDAELARAETDPWWKVHP